MTPKQFEQHLAEMSFEIQNAVNNDLPLKAANEAVFMFKENFQNESFFGEKWQEVQRRIPCTKTYKAVEKRNPTDTQRKILTGRTGNLGRSIKIGKITPNEVTIISDLPYSDAHNSGTGNAGRGHNTTIPQRKFMGDSPQLDAAINNLIQEELDKIIKK